MKSNVYSIRDSKADMYNLPFFQPTHGTAERTFSELVQDPKSMLHKYPDDYDLYFIGSYDDQNGVITALDTPQHIVKAISIKTN